MKKSLQKRIRSYSLTAGAVIAAGTAEGQVIYTDVNPDLTRTNNGDFYDLDLNNDATVDFRINLAEFSSTFTSIYYSSFFSYKVVYMEPSTSNSVAYYSGFLASAMNSGVTVDNAVGSWMSSSALLGGLSFRSYGGIYTYSSSIGAWNNTTDKYLGLRFKVSGQTHYGWARLDVDINTGSFTIKDYAYNGTANQSLVTGVVPADIAKAITGTDINDNINGSDLQVSFNKAVNESSVSEYRIMVVKSSQVPSFDLAAAQTVGASAYTAITPNGSNVTTTLAAGATDTDGDPITIAVPYRIFVLSIADGVVAKDDALSAASPVVTLNTAAAPALDLNAADVANNATSQDMQISFKKATNESGIAEYRAIVVKSADAASFNLAAAQAVATGNYTSIIPSGSDVQQTLNNGDKDKDGDFINQSVPYKFFVLSVANGVSANIDELSAESNEITLLPYTGIGELEETAINVYVSDQQITIDPGSLSFQQGQARISDMAGKAIGSYDLKQGKTRIPLAVENGIYLVRIEIEGSTVTKKVFVQK